MNRKLGFALICAFALTAVALDASACFMTYEGMDYKATVTVYAPGSAISGRTVYAGRHLIEYQDADLTAWCVDIDHWSGSSEVTERDAVSFLRNGQLVAYLFETFSPTIDSNYSAAALGVAIWEVINETQVDYLHRPIFNLRPVQDHQRPRRRAVRSPEHAELASVSIRTCRHADGA
ncbi:MAG: hypothetical protein GXY38_06165 [Planctomycetes bacterium]|jgi:hypothetical protein|nr:hypothetical protein [Planctomycetota bacterium]